MILESGFINSRASLFNIHPKILFGPKRQTPFFGIMDIFGLLSGRAIYTVSSVPFVEKMSMSLILKHTSKNITLLMQ